MTRTHYLQEVARALGTRLQQPSGRGSQRISLPAHLGRGRIYELSEGKARRLTVEVDVSTPLVLVIGAGPPPWSIAVKRLRDTLVPVYVPDKPPDEQAVLTWLVSGGEAAIAALELKVGERVSVFEDGVTADLLRESSPTMAAARIKSVAAFARAIPESRAHLPDQLLPSAFADLQALADRWAIPDDAMRSDALEGSPREEIESLVVAVAPRLPEIQAELDSATEPLSDAHLRLQLLAEATAEAQEAISARKAI